MTLRKQAKHRHKIHSKKIQPYLRAVINLLNPEVSVLTIKIAVIETNNAWKKYCTRYTAKNGESVDRKMLIKSLQINPDLKKYFIEEELIAIFDV